MEKLSTKIEKSKAPLSSVELIDYIIAFQMDKMEKYNNDPKNKITDKSESAMANMVELLKIRSSVVNRVNLYK